MKKWTAALAILIASASWATEVEIKGIRVGMSEQEFKKSYPKARCEKPVKPVAEKATVVLACGLSDFTVANHRASQTNVRFYGDKLGSLSFVLPGYASMDVLTAFAEKYGKASPYPGLAHSVVWSIGTTRMVMSLTETVSVVQISTEASDDEDRRRESARKAKARADI